MKILIACEFSGIVRDAFIAAGHDAVSCDLGPSERPGPHYQRDVLEILDWGWDMMVAFPPCTHISVSGARYFAEKRRDGRQQQAIGFFMLLAAARIERIAIENPVGIMSRIYRPWDQMIQPYEFGHNESKRTCLWLKNLPPLMATNCISNLPGQRRANQTMSGQNNVPPGPDRAKIRSKTYRGVADAMATQWGRAPGLFGISQSRNVGAHDTGLK